MPQAQSLFCRRSCRARQCPKHNLSFAEEGVELATALNQKVSIPEEVVELATALNQKFSFADEVVELASAPSTISLLPRKV